MEVIQGILFVTNNKGASSPSASLGSKHRVALEIHGAILGVVSLPSLFALRHCRAMVLRTLTEWLLIYRLCQTQITNLSSTLTPRMAFCSLPYTSFHFTLCIEVCAGQCIIIRRFDKEAWKRLR